MQDQNLRIEFGVRVDEGGQRERERSSARERKRKLTDSVVVGGMRR
jgi:hypothetical protein